MPTLQTKFNIGDKVRDRFTGFEGFVHAVARYITGCDRCLVNTRQLDDKGKPEDGTWFDETQLSFVAESAEPVVLSDERGGGPAPRAEVELRRS